MQKVLFFSRVVFLCNICFVLTLLIRLFPSLLETNWASTIIILGYPLAFVANALLQGLLVILKLSGKKLVPPLPAWLLYANLLFFIVQLIFFFR